MRLSFLIAAVAAFTLPGTAGAQDADWFTCTAGTTCV